MKLDLIHIVALIGIFQSLFLSFFFFTNKRGDSSSNKLFASLLFVFALNIGYSFTQSQGVVEYFRLYGGELYLAGRVAFLISPLLFLYIKSLLIPELKLQKKDLAHFILFFVSIISLLIFPYTGLAVRIWVPRILFLNGMAMIVQDAFYIGLIFYILHQYNIKIKDLFAPESSRISWLRIFVVAFIVIWNIKLQAFVFFNVEALWNFCPHTESLHFLIIFLFLNTIIFFALKSPELFSPLKKYESSELNQEEKSNYITRLTSLVESEKLYLDPKLTLPLLSKKSEIPVRYLSQIINEEFKKNFNDFINGYRIAESKKMLCDDSSGKKNILEIAYQVGFNSKSSFYDAFKRGTGLTPTQYKTNSLKEDNY